MKSWVVLLRGINVGSTRKLPMAELKALCADLGYANPRTYIQSGNLVVDAKGGARDIRAALEREIQKRFGFPGGVIVRSADSWEAYVKANPFAGEDVQAKMVHMILSADPLKPGAAASLAGRAAHGERIREAGGALWIDYGAHGAGRSKLTPALIDKACGSPATSRNWNTVLEIAGMISSPERAG